MTLLTWTAGGDAFYADRERVYVGQHKQELGGHRQGVYDDGICLYRD